jgi:hypothetical protein
MKKYLLLSVLLLALALLVPGAGAQEPVSVRLCRGQEASHTYSFTFDGEAPHMILLYTAGPLTSGDEPAYQVVSATGGYQTDGPLEENVLTWHVSKFSPPFVISYTIVVNSVHFPDQTTLSTAHALYNNGWGITQGQMVNWFCIDCLLFLPIVTKASE